MLSSQSDVDDIQIEKSSNLANKSNKNKATYQDIKDFSDSMEEFK